MMIERKCVNKLRDNRLIRKSMTTIHLFKKIYQNTYTNACILIQIM